MFLKLSLNAKLIVFILYFIMLSIFNSCIMFGSGGELGGGDILVLSLPKDLTGGIAF